MRCYLSESPRGADRPFDARTLRAKRSARLRGFSVMEMVLITALLGAVLVLISGIYEHWLTRARVADTRVLLARLCAATELARLDAPNAAPAPTRTSDLVRRLCAAPESAALLAELSPHLLNCEAAVPRCVDAWGTPIRFISPASVDSELQRRIQLAAGRAIFESAGPDRDFGERNPTRRIDNLRSDEPDLPSGGDLP
jgi:Tfp pilus assembly protein PilE